MTNLQKLFKEQEEEFKVFFKKQFENSSWSEITRNTESFIQSYNAKIIKAVCEEMTGEERDAIDDGDYGYNIRIQEEQQKAEELIKTNQ